MGVDFYAVKRGRRAENIYHGGYGGYHAIRGYLLSCFSTPLACAFFRLPSFRTPEEEKMLQDISPYVPEPAWTLFCSTDCEGDWSNAEVKGIVAAVKDSVGYKNPDKVKDEIEAIKTNAKRKHPDYPYYLCGYQHVPDWKDKAHEFIGALDRVAQKGCRVFWY